LHKREENDLREVCFESDHWSHFVGCIIHSNQFSRCKISGGEL
jgi:hypothetical protein